MNAAKRAAKEIPENIRGASVSAATETVALKARTAVLRKGNALNTFDDFGRDAERFYMQAKAKKSKPIFLSAEYQDCFGHSLVELLKSPETDDEMLATIAALRTLSEDLKDRGIISAFGFAPSDDVQVATAYTAAGFRKTGLLSGGIRIGEERQDAILWTRKLANPGADDDDE